MERLTKRNDKGIAVLNIRCPEGCEHVTCRPEEGYQCQHQCEGDIINKLAAYEDAEEQGLLLRLPCKVGTPMNDFLKFFEETVKEYPMHLKISYNKVADWGIHVYRKGCGENGKDLVIVDVSCCDMELCFAKAQVQLKEWLLENNGGY